MQFYVPDVFRWLLQMILQLGYTNEKDPHWNTALRSALVKSGPRHMASTGRFGGNGQS